MGCCILKDCAIIRSKTGVSICGLLPWKLKENHGVKKVDNLRSRIHLSYVRREISIFVVSKMLSMLRGMELRKGEFFGMIVASNGNLVTATWHATMPSNPICK
jgi:hypothetical protein